MRHRSLRALDRGADRGFTLVELMVSLVAGLIVTISVVALAKAATNTFFEQARISTVQGTVRSASERLRQDLSRAGFMSTGNIQLARNDNSGVALPYNVPPGHKVSHAPGIASPTARYAGINNLQGISITVDGSRVASVNCPGCDAEGTTTLSTVNGLKPDSIVLAGNFTTDDSYRGKLVGNTIVLTVPSAGNNYRGDVAVARLVEGDSDVVVRNAFFPGAANPPATPSIARIVDMRGCHHFVHITNSSATAAGAVITLGAALSGSPILTPAEDQSTCGANEQEEVSINPVQRVRWYLAPSNPALSPQIAIEPAGRKFDLYREYLDGLGNPVPAPAGAQLVAEYAVDLKFGITVDSNLIGVVAPNNQVTLDMDVNATDITKWTQAASLTLPNLEGPQRVRSVRFRLATRAALPDRKANLVLIPGQPYLSRYCVNAPTCTDYARVRTIMSEVALTNQAGMSY